MSENFRDLAHMDEGDFEGALSVALKMIIDSTPGSKRCDIPAFWRFLAPWLMVSSLSMEISNGLRCLLEMFTENGLDEMLRKCGWLPACHFKSFEPVEAKAMFVRVPGVSPTSMKFLISFTRSALVCVGMPLSTDGLDETHTKIKLWNVAGFQRQFAEDVSHFKCL